MAEITASDIFPIQKFYDFHPDANINYQLNRALYPGAEQLFTGIGKKIVNRAADLPSRIPGVEFLGSISIV